MGSGAFCQRGACAATGGADIVNVRNNMSGSAALILPSARECENGEGKGSGDITSVRTGALASGEEGRAASHRPRGGPTAVPYREAGTRAGGDAGPEPRPRPRVGAPRAVPRGSRPVG